MDVLFCRTDKWKQHTNIEEFMTYLLSVYNVTSAYSLGIRLRSLPLAIQVSSNWIFKLIYLISDCIVAVFTANKLSDLNEVLTGSKHI